jgi:hypothetical protein
MIAWVCSVPTFWTPSDPIVNFINDYDISRGGHSQRKAVGDIDEWYYLYSASFKKK